MNHNASKSRLDDLGSTCDQHNHRKMGPILVNDQMSFSVNTCIQDRQSRTLVSV
jgi:hypothetical protein